VAAWPLTRLIERDAAVTINAIENGGSAGGRDGVKGTFPAGALVLAVIGKGATAWARC
jgi:hypothetical protein